MTAPRRRWSFGLRALFIVMSASGALVAVIQAEPMLLAIVIYCGLLPMLGVGAGMTSFAILSRAAHVSATDKRQRADQLIL